MSKAFSNSCHLTMSSSTSSTDDCTNRNFASNPPTTCSESTSNGLFSILLPRLRSFLANGVNAWFWEIRQHSPPPEDLRNIHAGDIYLDLSTVPIGVYQRNATGWTSCWFEPQASKKFFRRLPHPRFKDRFLWTTQCAFSNEIALSYITVEELNSRGGTETDKQVCLLEDIKIFRPSITTAETLIARREEALHFQTGNSASSSMEDIENETDGIKEDLYDLEDDDWDSRTADTDRGEPIQPDLKSTASILKSIVTGLCCVKEDLESYLSSSKFYPEHESESVDTILSRLIQAIDKERQQHLAESDTKQELADTKVKCKNFLPSLDYCGSPLASKRDGGRQKQFRGSI